MSITTFMIPVGKALRAFIGFVAVISSRHAADVGTIVGPASPGV